MTTATIRANKFGGKCAGCQGFVPEGQGQLTGGPGNWSVRHLTGQCSTEAQKLGGAPEVTTMGIFRAPNGQLWVARPARKQSDKSRLVALALVPGPDNRLSAIYKKGAIYQLREADRMPYVEARAIALELGQCIVCCHKFGDDPDSPSTKASLKYGIGPDCRTAFPDFSLFDAEADVLL